MASRDPRRRGRRRRAVNPRRIACDVLMRVEGGAYSHVLLPQVLRDTDLSSRDRAQGTDLVYGTLRAQRRLDDRLAGFSRRPIRRLDPPVRAALRLGAYQLERGVPAHAAVGETAGIAPARSRGFVNAVLRALASAGPPWPSAPSDAVELSYPDWLVARLESDLGPAVARGLLLASNEVPGVSLRPNPELATPSALQDELAADGVEVTTGELVPEAVVARRLGDPAALAAVAEGRATPQDQASQAVVTFLSPERGERVLDVAAAPGGKATGIAERLGPAGLVVAADVHGGRLRLVRDGAVRLRLANVATVVADGRRLPLADRSVDRALVDAPCSGLGVLRRRAESRWRVEETAIDSLAEVQLALVLAAAVTVRSGGVLVYSVCTVTAAETLAVADRALAALPDFSPIAPPGAPWRPSGPGALLLPQDVGTDGMFVLGLRRAGA
jgi:16S rRNA (cytosine967-C5)-methyltransferase